MLLDLHQIARERCLSCGRIVHVGGNIGEEGELYTLWNSQVIWFEPRPDAAAVIRSRYPKHIVVEAAAGSGVGRADLRIASNGHSSSLLDPKLHLQMHPEVSFYDRMSVPIIPVDLVVQEADGLVVDVQGYEAMVLRGASRCLSTCRWVFLEVNRAELYSGCAMVEDLEAILADFERVETTWVEGKNWGDALWVRR